MCSDSKAINPVMEELMATPWLDGTVSDYIYLAWTTYPLPYHIHAFQTTQIVPYLLDLCTANADHCLMDSYKDYCFQQQEFVLSESNVSLNDFVVKWTNMVADEFGLD